MPHTNAHAGEGKDMDPNDTLVYFGGVVKALGGGRFAGYLVKFGSPDRTDFVGDFFTRDTDFGLDGDAGTTDVLYQHGQDETLGTKKIGKGTLKVDDAGVWMEAQLDLRRSYEKAVAEKYGKALEALIEGKALGLSSGVPSHLVEREAVGKATWLKTWRLGLDASLTPNPCEPRLIAVPLKSLPAPTLKLMAEGDDESGGATAPEDGEGKPKKPRRAFAPGDAVKWSSYANMKAGHGKVVSVHTGGNVPGTENDLEASEESPAAKVHVRERKPEGGYRDTGRHVAHPVSRLRPDRDGATKGAMLGDTDESVTLAALARLHEHFCACLYRLISSDEYDGAGLVDAADAAFAEYHEAAIDVIEALLGDETPGDDALETAKSLLNESADRLNTGLPLDDHADAVLTAVSGLAARLDALAALRATQDRKPLSGKRVESLKTLTDALFALRTRAENAAKVAPPKAAITRLRAALLGYESRAVLTT